MRKNALIFAGVAATAAGIAFLLLPGKEGGGALAGIDWLMVLSVLLRGLLAFGLAIVFHEVGHLLGAWIMRSRVARICLGPLVITPSPFRVEWAGIHPFFFGAIQCELSSYKDERTFAASIHAQRIVFAAGPVFSLVLGLIVLRFSDGLLEFMGMFGALSVGIGIATLLTDGTSAILLGSRAYALFFAWTALISASRLDTDKLNVLLAESKRHLQSFSPRSAQADKDLYDLNVLYYYRAMQSSSDEDSRIESIISQLLEQGPEASASSKHRDTVAMILAEEVVRLHEAGRTEAANRLMERLRIGWELDPLSSLKLEAFMRRSKPHAESYLDRIRAMGTKIHSYGALLDFERSRLNIRTEA
ncbi:hypothetical protein B9G55_11430 [Saccharibacillus sp. O16]|nr:hypothetical protein B9G55_11430 [Saccharibacillus sp. O16]